MNFLIDYNLTGTGWAECRISLGTKSTSISASYLSDALGALANHTCQMLQGTTECSFSFDEEPGEYRWILHRIDPDRLEVRILEFPELWSNAPNSEGKLIFEATCRLKDFGQAVATALNKLIEQHGEEGYHEKWGEHPFPLESHKNLKLLLERQ
jgi:hypothetical protein